MAEKNIYQAPHKHQRQVSNTYVNQLLHISDAVQDHPLSLLKQDAVPLSAWSTPQLEQPTTTKQVKKKRNGTCNNNMDKSQTTMSFGSGAWTNSMETHSFRYVPNNGCYRELKSQILQLKSSKTSRKPPTRPQPTTLNLEQRRLQREVTSDLRRELNALKNSSSKGPTYFNIDDSLINDQAIDRDEDYVESGNSKTLNFQITSSASFTPKQIERQVESKSALPLRSTDSTELETIRSKCHSSSSMNTNSTPIDMRYKTVIQGFATAAESDASDRIARRANNRKILNVERLLKSTVSQPSKLDYAGEKNVAALAKQTFHAENSAISTLRPIEKLTPSMREAYDNSRATQQMIKIRNSNNNSVTTSLPDEMTAKSIHPMQCEAMKSWLESDSAIVGHVPHSMKTSLKYSTTSYPQYKVNRLGEARDSSKQAETSLVQLDSASANSTTFLPCISGKRITTKLGSLR